MVFFSASLVTLMGSSGWKITAWETWVWREGRGNSLGGKILRRLMVIAHGICLVPVVSRARQNWAWIFLGRKIVLESVDIPLGRGFKSGIWEVKRNSDIIPTLIKKLARLLPGRLLKGSERSLEGLARMTQKRNLKTVWKYWVSLTWPKRNTVS